LETTHYLQDIGFIEFSTVSLVLLDY